MEIVIGAHALERMLERNVTISDIQYALHRYSISFSTGEESSQLRAMFPDGRVLKIWIGGGVPFTDPVIIRTVAWMEPIDE